MANERKNKEKEEEKVMDQAVVPSEIFTTMRYNQDGLSLQQMCTTFSVLKHKVEDKLDQREEIPLLERHLIRLQEAIAQMKGLYPMKWGACPIDLTASIRLSLSDEIAKDTLSEKGVNRRMRISINRAGVVRITSFTMSNTNPLQGETLKVRLDSKASSDQLDAPECLYRIKTGYREMYDVARSRVNATLDMTHSARKESGECFDVIMTQAYQGKIYMTESSIANILLHLHDSNEILTPSDQYLALLNGLFRQELLYRGYIKKADLEVFQVLNLLNQDKATLYLCNALRGVIPVTLI